MGLRDYYDWHDAYGQPGTPLFRRLEVIVRLLGDALDASPAGPVRVVSICAGQGADVLAVVEHHPRGRDLVGRLVELDARNAAVARQRIETLGADAIEVLEADAGRSDAYVGAVPADLVLVCGVFGNITLADIERTVRYLPALCAAGGTVLWTRHPREAGVLDSVRGWLADSGFEETAFEVAAEAYGVGSARLVGASLELEPGVPLFEFVR